LKTAREGDSPHFHPTPFHAMIRHSISDSRSCFEVGEIMEQNQPIGPQGSKSNPIIKIIWMAMMFAVIIYGVAGMVVSKSNNGVQTPENINFISAILGLVALGDTAFLFLGVKKIFSMKPGMSPLPESNYMTFCIIRWAMAEAIAIFGLILLIMGASIATGLFFLSWSFVMMLFLSPSDDEKRKFLGSTGV
jgi:hypothetical protein